MILGAVWMRKLIERILARYGYVKADARAWEGDKTDPKDIDKMTRATRWIAFYNEHGGIGDFIHSVRASYFAKVAELEPNNTAGLQALAMADKIARELDGQIKAVIDAGKVEQTYKEHAERIAALPEAQRRRL